jgi:hypothetical protein
MNLFFLFASVALSLLAPLLYRSMLNLNRFWTVFEKILSGSVGALVVLHLLPECIMMLGWIAVLIAMLGLFLPVILEFCWSSGARNIHHTSIFIGILGIITHGLMDGAALALPSLTWNSLPVAVILHRLPAGMLIQSITQDSRIKNLATYSLILLSIATIVGFFFGNNIISLQIYGTQISYFQAFVSGSLLHVVFDSHTNNH